MKPMGPHLQQLQKIKGKYATLYRIYRVAKQGG